MNWEGLIMWLGNFFEKSKKINTSSCDYNASLKLPYYYHLQLTKVTSEILHLGCKKSIKHHKNSHAIKILMHKTQYIK